MLVQGIPTMPVPRLVIIIKSLAAQKIFWRHPKIRKDIVRGENLWKNLPWVGYASKDTIKEYSQNQSNPDEYEKMYEEWIELDLWS